MLIAVYIIIMIMRSVTSIIDLYPSPVPDLNPNLSDCCSGSGSILGLSVYPWSLPRVRELVKTPDVNTWHRGGWTAPDPRLFRYFFIAS